MNEGGAVTEGIDVVFAGTMGVKDTSVQMGPASVGIDLVYNMAEVKNRIIEERSIHQTTC